MDYLTTELHCHNLYSNFHVGDHDAPYDCNVTIEDQLAQAHKLGLDAIFVTNHNTLDGYKQLVDFKNNHEKYQKIQIYPAEEITTDDGSHIIAYGLSEAISPGKSFYEILDEINKQSAISSAPHPFSLLDALRDYSKNCDLIEVFNSNNVDILANTKATLYAKEHNMVGIAASDSHVLSTLGRCTNLIESENTLDGVLSSMKHGKIKIHTTGYASAKETIDHLRYKIENSHDYLYDYMSTFYPKSKRLFSLLLQLFERNPNSYLWILFYKFAIFAMKRISNKINFQNLDPILLKDRNIGTMLKAAF